MSGRFEQVLRSVVEAGWVVAFEKRPATAVKGDDGQVMEVPVLCTVSNGPDPDCLPVDLVGGGGHLAAALDDALVRLDRQVGPPAVPWDRNREVVHSYRGTVSARSHVTVEADGRTVHIGDRVRLIDEPEARDIVVSSFSAGSKAIVSGCDQDGNGFHVWLPVAGMKWSAVEACWVAVVWPGKMPPIDPSQVVR